ncbi:MAG: transcription elongation factor GreB [Burkholderiaceae bacterium]
MFAALFALREVTYIVSENLDFSLDEDDDDGDVSGAPAAPYKNYITKAGEARLRAELLQLLDVERPIVVEAVHWAAKNGDRSENGDYIYGKKRLREIDRRLRFLTKRLAIAEVVDTTANAGSDQVFFGATVTYSVVEGAPAADPVTVQIVGVDEVQHDHGQISWISPVAKALLKAHVGDEVRVQTPTGRQTLCIEAVQYI